MAIEKNGWWFQNLGRTLTWIGRHAAPSLGMQVLPGGWIASLELQKCLAFATGRFRTATPEDIRTVVTGHGGDRLEAEFSSPDSCGAEWQFRAVQGHTFDVPDRHLLYRPLPDTVTTAYHYTGFGAARRILKSKRLSRLERLFIHFSQVSPPDSARADKQVAIQVDITSATEEHEFFISRSGAILCAGDDNGFLDSKYFSAVWVKCTDGEWIQLDPDDQRIEALKIGPTPPTKSPMPFRMRRSRRQYLPTPIGWNNYYPMNFTPTNETAPSSLEVPGGVAVLPQPIGMHIDEISPNTRC